ncbi:GNAT family N-acetyltransferase [Halobacteriovorax sp.]|uniref:GNAT family N-acetyltransferase n=1 Tax=Halobacteriovorax sp. TaxID=2020862 RepID=UPI0035688AA7
MSSKKKLIHDEQKQQLYFSLPEGEAYVTYNIENGIWNLNYSLVSHELRGQGIAKDLVKQTLEFALDRNIKIKISCSYIDKVFNQDLDKYSSLME